MGVALFGHISPLRTQKEIFTTFQLYSSMDIIVRMRAEDIYNSIKCHKTYLPFAGPTLSLSQEEEAVIASSGISPDCIPRANLHSSTSRKRRDLLYINFHFEILFKRRRKVKNNENLCSVIVANNDMYCLRTDSTYIPTAANYIITARESGQVKVLHMSVCLSVCLCFWMITFELIDLLTHFWYVSRSLQYLGQV